MPGPWPLRTFLELGALPGAVPCARLHARLVAWEWGLAGLGDDAELLVSELLTNAVAASRVMEPIFPVRLWLVSGSAQIAILVWDANPQPPVPTQIDDQAETGRGLLLVEAVSEQWGWYTPQDTTGKVVWAVTRRHGTLCPDVRAAGLSRPGRAGDHRCRCAENVAAPGGTAQAEQARVMPLPRRACFEVAVS
jgi:anti-sigma regulatory factor (Ser/Thr protein kinase)